LFVVADAGGINYTGLEFSETERLRLWDSTVSGTECRVTSAQYRDVSAWYHIVLAVDTTQSTASNRVKLYVNGSQVTQFSVSADPALNADLRINAAVVHSIGSWQPAAGLYFNGYLADIHFIDGQALTPSSFGETDATTGAWIPKAYSGTYGTNGFKLDFADNSNNTATTLGKDSSGNGNNFTPNNLSVTAGSGNDSLVDSPTNYGTDTGAGGEVRGNYCTLNLLKQGSLTLSDGNLQVVHTADQWDRVFGTIGMSSGKWYWEVVSTSLLYYYSLGIAKEPAALTNVSFLADANIWEYYNFNGNKVNSSATTYGATFGVNDIIGVAFDADVGTLTFYKNNTSQGTAFTGLTSGPYFPSIAMYRGSTEVFNFGQRPFAYTAPSGFKALCTQNLPAPGVTKPSTAMDVKLYTGNGSTQTISGLGFGPDLVWVKARSSAQTHSLTDSVRGVSKQLFTNLTNAEGSETDQITALNSDGFSLGANAAGTGGVNSNSTTYAAWCWDAGSSTVTNTAGSITSSVRANTSAGFSIVTYTGTRTSAGNDSIGHGLGVAPSLVISKQRNGTSPWIVQHASLGTDDYLELNTTSAITDSVAVGAGALPKPTSTVFYGSWLDGLNANTDTFVAYCFAPIAGFSAFGSYTGNGSSTDAPFVYLGFQPAFLMLKRTDSTSNWTMVDAKREGYNVDNDPLYANLSNAEGTTDLVDLTSNGFKLRTTDTSVNASSGTYIYAAFAEQPFKTSRAR
jgi:hypothetical protein